MHPKRCTEETYVGITRQRCNAIYYMVGHPRPQDTDGVHHSTTAERAVEERYRRAWTRWEQKDSTLDYHDALTSSSAEPKPPSCVARNLPQPRHDFQTLTALWTEIHRAWLDPIGDYTVEAISRNWWIWEPKFDRVLESWSVDWRRLEPEDRSELGLLAAGGALAVAGPGDGPTRPEDALRFGIHSIKPQAAPATSNAVASPGSGSARSPAGAGSRPVALLLNDREDECDAMASVLKECGYEVRATKSMDEAIDVGGDDDLDVAVIDWRLTESWRAVGWLEDGDPAGLVPEPTSAHLLRLLNAARPELPIVVHSPDAGSLQLEGSRTATTPACARDQHAASRQRAAGSTRAADGANAQPQGEPRRRAGGETQTWRSSQSSGAPRASDTALSRPRRPGHASCFLDRQDLNCEAGGAGTRTVSLMSASPMWIRT